MWPLPCCRRSSGYPVHCQSGVCDCQRGGINRHRLRSAVGITQLSISLKFESSRLIGCVQALRSCEAIFKMEPGHREATRLAARLHFGIGDKARATQVSTCIPNCQTKGVATKGVFFTQYFIIHPTMEDGSTKEFLGLWQLWVWSTLLKHQRASAANLADNLPTGTPINVCCTSEMVEITID
jgi:hypothetical protein